MSRFIFNHKNELNELCPYFLMVVAFYVLATFQWIRILSSELSLTYSYALVTLGVFLGIKFTSSLTR